MGILDRAARHWYTWALAASWQLALLVCIVAGVCYLARGASPRLRHGLWLLVLAKVFLPPGLTTPISVGRWAVAPLLAKAGIDSIDAESSLVSDRPGGWNFAPGSENGGKPPVPPSESSFPELLLAVWLVGGLLFWIVIAGRYAIVARVVRSARPLDEGPLRVSLEQIAIELNLRHVPDLLATDTVTVPFLFGVVRPAIVVPSALLDRMSDVELRSILTHELVHWQRRDTWIGWLQVLGQSIFWFHPFLWWANTQLRHERECACDEAVLRLGHIAPRRYGESILRVLTESRARSLAGGSLVGVFEPGAKLQNRLEEIMSFEPIKREFTWARGVTLAAFAVLFLPMAPGAFDRPVVAADEGGTKSRATEADAAAKPYPQIVSTIPKNGATDVDPALTEISVTFDRDMSKGMSWTGGPPLFPPTDESRPARWTDARTCVLPVSLKKASYYRVGINSTSYRNFQDKTGLPAPCSVIAFVTTGAGDAVRRRVRVPKITAIDPENGALDVDPETVALRVTFDMPMGDGMSWTGGGPSFPKESPDGKQAIWSKDGKKCTLPVLLEAGHDYELGLNSLKHINFQSKWGIPLEPVVYRFHTRDAIE